MEKIYYTQLSNFPNSESAVLYLLKRDFNISSATIYRGDNGKPFLDIPLFFSISHTKTHLFIAFSSENIGIDAEQKSREIDYSIIQKKFHPSERQEILCKEDFLRNWIVKESAIKWLGGSIAKDFSRLMYANGLLKYGEIEVPAKLTRLEIENHFVCVCSERDFSKAEIIRI